MKKYDIYCDASINTSNKIACAGCIFVDLDTKEYTHYNLVQYNATNNSAEILAIWLGIAKAVEYKQALKEPVYFRLFSDSKISLFGLKRWIFSWIKGQGEDHVLYSTSGQPVANQKYFIDIYNMIVMNDLNIELYHQRGHIRYMSSVDLARAEKYFYKQNNVTTHKLGVTTYDICKANDAVDNATRDIVTQVTRGSDPSKLENTEVELIFPLISIADRKYLGKYSKCISNGFNNYNNKGE